MGGFRSSGRLAVAAAALGVLVVATSAGAAKAPDLVVLATSADNAELRNAVPIGKRQDARPRLAMSLTPDQFEPIVVGDRLVASGEVQVSTTCVQQEPRCIGRHYDINPKVTARIVLSSAQDAAAPSIPLSGTTQKLCKQRRPNRNHHCTLTIPSFETTITDLTTLPCAPTACYVNLIVTAANKHAKRGNVVVLGADRPDGTVAQDKGRVNLVQAHAPAPAPSVSASNQLLNPELPLTITDSEKRRVVYSVPIPAPRAGEILTFDASFMTGISAIHFNTFISSRVITAETPVSTDAKGIAKRAIPLKGQATESNGFNCTLGSSGFANPCTVTKAGAVQFTRDVVDKSTGQPATIYLNVLAGAKPLLAEKVEETDKVSLAATPSGLIVSRYTP
jgi:hypothetical protein